MNPPMGSAPFSADEQFHLLMESVSDYAIFFTDPERHVVTWNLGAERILKWTEAEIVGQSAMIIWTPEDRENGAAGREFTKAASEGRAADERWHQRKDGSRFWASGILTALRDEGGNLRGYCKILRDLTERKRWEDELQAAHDKQSRIADTLQHSLLMFPPPDVFPGITVKPLYQPASDDALIGGDFFDVYAVEENKIALVVGDATGKGLEAATYTAEVKFALRAFLREYPHPAVALQRLNALVNDKARLDPLMEGDSFIALAVCLVHTHTGHLVCAWAGIEPPFIVRTATSEVVELSACGGLLIGVIESAEYQEQSITLEEGDILAMSTDGLTEARRRRGTARELFGYDGLVQAVREETSKTDSLADAGAAVIQRARTFAEGTMNDDVCLLLARCSPQKPGM